RPSSRSHAPFTHQDQSSNCQFACGALRGHSEMGHEPLDSVATAIVFVLSALVEQRCGTTQLEGQSVNILTVARQGAPRGLVPFREVHLGRAYERAFDFGMQPVNFEIHCSTRWRWWICLSGTTSPSTSSSATPPPAAGPGSWSSTPTPRKSSRLRWRGRGTSRE